MKGTKIVKKSSYEKELIYTTLEKIRNEDVGDEVSVVGIVAVEPGVLASQYFYIVGSPGIQIYMYKKDFPDLEIGDKVEVRGELSESGGEARLKVSEKENIKKIGHVDIPQPRVTEISEIGETFEGWLIEINGEITDMKGSYMYVDDGTDEIKVYFKRGAGINKDEFQEGDIVSVAGLVHQTKSEYQLLPRFSEDIVKTGVVEEFVTKIEEQKQENVADLAEKYLTATAGGLTAIFVGLFTKSHGKKFRDFFRRITLWIKKRK